MWGGCSESEVLGTRGDVNESELGTTGKEKSKKTVQQMLGGFKPKLKWRERVFVGRLWDKR